MSEQKYLKYCTECAKIDDIPGAKYHVCGYKDFYDSDNFENCLECGNKLTQLSMLCEDYRTLAHISTEPDFMNSMVKLQEKDPIEFQLKMSQFKANLSQAEEQESKSNKKKCPYCGHTEFTPVRKKWSFWAGFATNKTELICNNCGKKVE